MDMSMGKLWELVKDREAWCCSPWGPKELDTQLGNWTTIIIIVNIGPYVCVCVCVYICINILTHRIKQLRDQLTQRPQISPGGEAQPVSQQSRCLESSCILGGGGGGGRHQHTYPPLSVHGCLCQLRRSVPSHMALSLWVSPHLWISIHIFAS